MRKFEKISLNEFEKLNTNCDYNDIALPIRKTRYSAGYDFTSFCRMSIKPHETLKIPTGVKIKLNDDEYLAIYVRSSMGIKNNIILRNQVGIIDADYYDNEDNEGHIWICVKNDSDKSFVIEKGMDAYYIAPLIPVIVGVKTV